MKTAEEIFRQELNLAAVKHGEDPVLNEDWDDWKDEQGPEFMEAMWSSYTQFAAQEIETYKERLKSEIAERISNDNHDSCAQAFDSGLHTALTIIDTVK